MSSAELIFLAAAGLAGLAWRAGVSDSVVFPGGSPARERKRAPRPDATLYLALVRAAVRSGAAIPRALHAAGEALGSDEMVRAGRLLLLGAAWEEAWAGVGRGSAEALVQRALAPAWSDGANPVPLLERASASWLARRDRRAREAAARLGVRLVLPLGACYLPAFMLIGVVPVVLATGGALVLT